jgi:hypothetical protein
LVQPIEIKPYLDKDFINFDNFVFVERRRYKLLEFTIEFGSQIQLGGMHHIELGPKRFLFGSME